MTPSPHPSKPFQDLCGAIERKEYVRITYNARKNKRRETVVPAKLCENKIWFEPSLKDGVMVGKCPVQTHNPVYKIL